MTLPAFNHPWVDESHKPVYVCRDPRYVSDAAQGDYISRLEAWTSEADEPYSWVVVPGKLSPRQRNVLTASLKRMRTYLKMHQVALAFVLPNPLVRGVVSAVLWFSPPPGEHRIFAELAPALIWAQRTHNAGRTARVGMN